MMNKKVVVIGLDGGTLDYILPWINELPTFKKLFKQGSWGNLRTVIPPQTSVAWPSFLTGKYPTKHGVFAFFHKTPSHDIEFTNSKNIVGPTIFDILNHYGKKIISVNVPVTYPTWSVDGILISGMLTPMKSKFCFPEEIADELPDYQIEPDISFNENNIDKFIACLYNVLEKRVKYSFYLMEKYNWDLFTVVFRITDIVGHTFRRYLEPENPLHERYGKTILNIYKKIDDILKQFLDRMSKDTVLFVMSDHGHGHIIKTVNLNMWLMENGYLKFKNDFVHRIKYFLLKKGFSRERIYNFLKKIGLQNIGNKISNRQREKTISALFLSYKDIDWGKTKAYSLGGTTGQIYINTKSGKKSGIITSEADYEDLREELKHKLIKIKDPENNKYIFEKILKREELYKGPLLEKAPDLYLIPTNYDYHCYDSVASDFSIFHPSEQDRWSGGHKMNGIFAAIGENIKGNNKINNAEIIDLAPSILQIFKLPVPKDMDGKILESVFKEKISNKIKYSDALQIERNYKGKFIKDEKKIEDRLRNLGYL